MKIAVVGVGGVGGYFGARLAEAGNDVIFVSRGPTFAKMRSDGLYVNSIKGNVTLEQPNVSNKPADIGQVDLVLLCVKAWQVAEVAPSLQTMLDDRTVVLPLQNGIDAPKVLSIQLGYKFVVGGMCRVVAFKTAPNIIEHTDVEPFIALGELDNSKSRRVEAIAEVLGRAGIVVKIPEDIHSAMWQKFLFVASTSGIGAVTRSPMGVIRKLPGTRELFIKSINEIIAIASREGISLPEDIVAKSMDYLDMLKEDSTSSTQRDIMEGRPSELEALNGAVVTLGQQLGVETPVNSFIYSSLLPMELSARNKLQIGNNFQYQRSG